MNPEPSRTLSFRMRDGSERIVNLTPQDHRFLGGIIAVLCDPAEEQQLRLLREDRAALRYCAASGELYFIPNSERDPINPNSKN